MARIVLHVGTHKTATTTIQKTLHLNRAAAASAGLIYPELRNQHHGLTCHWVRLPAFYAYAEGARAAWDRIIADHAAGEGTVLISSEEFSRGTPGNRVDYGELRSWLAPFESVEVVCVLREQVSLIQSIFLEVFRKNGQFPWARYFDACIEQRLGTGVHLDYNALHDALLTGFDAEEITYLPFRAEGERPDPMGTLLRHIGFDTLATQLNRHDTNVSGDPLATWIMGQLGGQCPSDPALEANIRRVFKDRPSFIYNWPEYQSVIRTFAPLNDRFIARQSGVTAGDLKLLHLEKGRAFLRNDMGAGHWMQVARTLLAAQTAAQAA
ncbi:hypothetical protein [Jannaschia pohangensis]|uniref:Sulfotransferase family protein n=1 Tax=Jannaschia pohangensis TaxID=390807 RepID=A0A1I3RCC0_9RHOB|nr:hypothetical protein [Jannaschia pohangensis]SFJ43938.1 hypothetical protein SAMN04488095_2875 [Jannaschia pohangensis]